MNNYYNDLKFKKEMELQDRKEQLYLKYPQLKEMDINIVECFTKKAMLLINENIEEIKELDKKIEEVKNKKAEFIKQNDIDEKYDQIKYECEICKDTGFINGKKCICNLLLELNEKDNIYDFKKHTILNSFEKLNKEYYKQDLKINNHNSYYEYMESLLSHVQNKINDIENNSFNALFVGYEKTGKSFLAKCVGTEFFKKGKSVLFRTSAEYIETLKPNYNGLKLDNIAKECELFIIDDLGSEQSTEFTTRELNKIISDRFDKDKSTIITTNLSRKEIFERYPSSMVSRIMSKKYTIYILKGKRLR